MSNETILNLDQNKLSEVQKKWDSAKPFHYVVIDDFLTREFAEEILASYPGANGDDWNNTTYVHQRNKLTMTKDFPSRLMISFV